MTMQLIKTLFKSTPHLENGVYIQSVDSCYENQNQTKDAFSEKWKSLHQSEHDREDSWKVMQVEWYLKLYGYESEEILKQYIQSRKIILDAGCGLGYKAAWFSELALIARCALGGGGAVGAGAPCARRAVYLETHV